MICLDARPEQQTFVGLGVNPKGAGEKEMEQLLVDEYNVPPLTCEPLSKEIIAKKFPMGHEANTLFMKFIGHPSAENESQLRACLTHSRVPHGYMQTMIEEGKRLSQPLKREEIKDPLFGYREELVVDFNLGLVHELMQAPLDKVSMDLVEKIKRQCNPGYGAGIYIA